MKTRLHNFIFRRDANLQFSLHFYWIKKIRYFCLPSVLRLNWMEIEFSFGLFPNFTLRLSSSDAERRLTRDLSHSIPFHIQQRANFYARRRSFVSFPCAASTAWENLWLVVLLSTRFIQTCMWKSISFDKRRIKSRTWLSKFPFGKRFSRILFDENTIWFVASAIFNVEGKPKNSVRCFCGWHKIMSEVDDTF